MFSLSLNSNLRSLELTMTPSKNFKKTLKKERLLKMKGNNQREGKIVKKKEKLL